MCYICASSFLYLYKEYLEITLYFRIVRILMACIQSSGRIVLLRVDAYNQGIFKPLKLKNYRRQRIKNFQVLLII